MADTIRTESTLLTSLFQDGQAANSITEQDMRDLIVSMRPAYGECSMQGNSTATTISATSTFYKVAGTTALTSGGHLVDDASSTSNRLRYTGAAVKTFMVQATFSFDASSNNQVLVYKLYKYDDSGVSGAVIDESQMTMDYHGEQINGTIQALVSLDTNDYVELHVSNSTSTADVTVKDLNMQAIGYLA